MEKYPPLSLGGVYKLLLFQCGGDIKGFYSLPTPYTPLRLKDMAGQATIYIRPLQKDILTDEARNDGQSTGEVRCRIINYSCMIRITMKNSVLPIFSIFLFNNKTLWEHTLGCCCIGVF